MKINMNRLKNYLSDLDPDTSIVDEAIATIEAVAENKTDDELYERERPLMIAYLALRIVKAGLNVSLQNNEVHGRWVMSTDRTYMPQCTNCGSHPFKGYIPSVEEVSRTYKFCPCCGAKMDEDESEG